MRLLFSVIFLSFFFPEAICSDRLSKKGSRSGELTGSGRKWLPVTVFEIDRDRRLPKLFYGSR